MTARLVEVGGISMQQKETDIIQAGETSEKERMSLRTAKDKKKQRRKE
jgi:hypothetical protein